ncbi:Bug family tripartite tricarboxylate transporter substrate binding protein [Jiangella asiatica]|uniref:Tripartite tricarboxylate transporter substrate binding protein n=1 Tax=Jiangella asiatica TaxID=2530372 RepID=A0A4R5DIM2_9ACTN|nr:tripartite tricarboxylate transporter substrate-binding protein [Jiangella asiatica]TDE11774.1 tripartite tricarboxylate transporter substrate binding protein [Jiangella asiatica]
MRGLIGPARAAIGATALVAALATTLTACGESGGETASGSGLDGLSIMVPAEPGGGWDQTGRAVQKALDDSGLASGVEVSNVGGAGGTVGLAQLANQRGGDTTLMVTGLVMVGAVETNQSQVRLEDTTPIARLTSEDLIVVVPAESPYQTVDDLVDDILANGKDVAVTGGSAGGADHILAGLLLKDAGVPAEELSDTLNYVAYSGGGESLAALLGNQVDAGISGIAEYSEQVAAGELRALAVSGSEPVEGIDAPTLTEAGYDVELTNWRGLVARGELEDDDRQALVDLATDLHESEEWQAELERTGWGDAFLAGDEFGEFLTEDIASVQNVLRDIGLVQ